jgi:CRISPR-associated endonuclease Csy4
MDHYLDLTLRPDPEFAPQQLMAALYAKLHRALVAQHSNSIGVSFPEVDEARRWLGLRLRLHGTLPELTALMQTPWLTGMRDHVDANGPAPVPPSAGYRTVRRIQADSNPERLRRRLMRRHQLDEAAAHQRIPDSAAVFLKLPYLQLRSTSTGQHFRLFIAHGPLQPEPVVGSFSAYGLSPTATIPWF